MAEYVIKYLKLSDENSPLVDWLNSLDKVHKVRIMSRIERIHAGNFGDCKKISAEISELRLMFGGGYRIYFHQYDNVVILLINGGDKSTQSKDINKAKALLQNWRQENEIQLKTHR